MNIFGGMIRFDEYNNDCAAACEEDRGLCRREQCMSGGLFYGQ